MPKPATPKSVPTYLTVTRGWSARDDSLQASPQPQPPLGLERSLTLVQGQSLLRRNLLRNLARGSGMKGAKGLQSKAHPKLKEKAKNEGHTHPFAAKGYMRGATVGEMTFPLNRGQMTLDLAIVSSQAAMASAALICDTEQWKGLQAHIGAIQKTHLRDLMGDADRCNALTAEYEGIFLDYSRQRATGETMGKLFKLAEAANLKEKIEKMFRGDKINTTENRSVLHVALRAPRDAVINSDGVNVVPEVWGVKDKIKQFSETFRSGSWVGATGKALTNVVSVGIGGSFLGPLFVHTALQTDPEAAKYAEGRQLRFLANVDPVDVARSIKDLDPETTLVVVVSKTFTTAETMLNARTLKEWIISSLGPHAVAKHMIAVSTNLKLVKEFGIDPNNAFAFWDWVGGRYSVCSAVGVLPLSLQYGFPIVQKFLEGASSIDDHFRLSPFEKNIPVLLGLLSVWNVSFLGYPARAILPYSQALEKFAPHIQQLSMESNGKGVFIDGVQLPFETGEIDFGEPGTNGQHSFYQLIHQVMISTSRMLLSRAYFASIVALKVCKACQCHGNQLRAFEAIVGILMASDISF
ncbi:hypothetical protein GUJ93_ZPchr0003g16806 [Zizania palustris]|uniref:glucose-6-phosphate isomerase n=1 Tax=Zizania palustris TaxID=103762 RepID=A0A8J5SRH0_ZIZPA|nr:hypothetical protein GUJ93_ZPchr0003g16806 [Zizania palustris]